MTPDTYPSAEVYAVVERLMRLRDLLHTRSHTMGEIITDMPADYTDDATGHRRIRRDIRNLTALGYHVQRQQRPPRWSITAGPHTLADDDVRALIAIREAFTDHHPLASAVTSLLATLTRHLTTEQQKLWQRRPVFRTPLNPALDYRDYAEVIDLLERAMLQNRQVSFWYRARGRDEAVHHPRLDPYEIEYTDRQFYLIAFSYRYGTILSFRLNRIVYTPEHHAPALLPDSQQPRRQRQSIMFTYRLPASFADGGVSERFTIHSVQTDEQYVTIEASDSSEFRIIRTLLGYGEHALLLDGPPTLLDRMRTTVARMSKQYAVLDSEPESDKA
jgi:predicted DNA-binding transcriptional regulator YafY